MTYLTDKSWKEFFNKHPELCGEETPSKALVCALLRDKYKPYFLRATTPDEIIDAIERLPVPFETMRREAQQFKSNYPYYKVSKIKQPLWR